MQVLGILLAGGLIAEELIVGHRAPLATGYPCPCGFQSSGWKGQQGQPKTHMVFPRNQLVSLGWGIWACIVSLALSAKAGGESVPVSDLSVPGTSFSRMEGNGGG